MFFCGRQLLKMYTNDYTLSLWQSLRSLVLVSVFPRLFLMIVCNTCRFSTCHSVPIQTPRAYWILSSMWHQEMLFWSMERSQKWSFWRKKSPLIWVQLPLLIIGLETVDAKTVFVAKTLLVYFIESTEQPAFRMVKSLRLVFKLPTSILSLIVSIATLS